MVNLRHLRQVVYVGDGGGLHAKHFHFIGHAPLRQFDADTRQGVAPAVVVCGEEFVPGRMEQQAVSWCPAVEDRGQDVSTEQGPVFGYDWLQNPGPAGQLFRGELIDRARPGVEMLLGVHVRPDVGVQVERPCIPTIFHPRPRLLPLIAGKAIGVGVGEVVEVVVGEVYHKV